MLPVAMVSLTLRSSSPWRYLDIWRSATSYGLLARTVYHLPMPFLIVGLGNPGAQYARTRHNAGFVVVEKLAGKDFRLKGNLLLSKFGEGYAIKPVTYYNEAGKAVAPFVRYHNIPLDRLLVIHDELDLPVGRLRLKAGGSSAGNKGVESIKRELGEAGFHRLRIGVGKPPAGIDGADWVLSGFRPEERKVVDLVLGAAQEAVKVWIAEGLEAARRQFNGLDFAPSLIEDEI